ncbi:MAG: ABC transporter ATP-binding protein, partial [Nitrospinota bacterium]
MSSPPREEPAPSVRMAGITKVFSRRVVANDRISFSARAGEIHGLLGENGAGKTTLMKILYGLYEPDAGDIFIRGNREDIASPLRAIQLGIGMVHQHFMLVQPLRVVENVLLAQRGNGRVLLDLESAAERIARISEEYHLRVDPWARIWQLSVGEQQRVEILNALYHGADILILDEPTSVLTPQESDELGRALRLMAEGGKTIVFISHKLDEAIRFTDRVTVLRDGRVVETRPTAGTRKVDLARMMVGREVLFHFSKSSVPPGEPVCQVEALSALNNRGLPALRGLSFAVHRGEILGIAGVDGNGQRELA